MLSKDSLLQNRYRIIRLFGHGGMGAVYEAIDERLGHKVAVKQTLLGNSDIFLHEAQLLASLYHPALPRIIDHIIVEDVGQFLVMDFIPGNDLATALIKQGGPFTIEDVLAWADQLFDVLEYLHSRNPPVIHRDIKPANLKLNERGKLMLLDFGLAKGRANEAGGLPLSVPGYTPGYAAPEQERASYTDERSDLYAIAATLYKLLTDVDPPNARDRLLALSESKADPLRRVNELNPTVQNSISIVLHKALALEPNERFDNAQEMRIALCSAMSTTQFPMMPPKQTERSESVVGPQRDDLSIERIDFSRLISQLVVTLRQQWRIIVLIIVLFAGTAFWVLVKIPTLTWQLPVTEAILPTGIPPTAPVATTLPLPTNRIISPTDTTLKTEIVTLSGSQHVGALYQLKLVAPITETMYYIESSDFDGVGMITKATYLGVFRYHGDDFRIYYGFHEGILTVHGSEGTLKVTRLVTDTYSSSGLSSPNKTIGRTYYIQKVKDNPVVFTFFRDDIYAISNPAWEGVGFFDGSVYWGIFRYVFPDGRFQSVMGRHMGTLQADGSFKVYGTNLFHMIGSFEVTWDVNHN